ncbi:MAG: peroxiredoxin [Gammaproteobacteria bacterium]|nr:MAG: peroxiredoxin [Gammaproteobacteria bacterium]
MDKVEIGKPVPDLEREMTGGKTFRLSDYRGQKVVMYFYPKDNTPGCTTEGQAFRDHYEQFKAAGAEIFGVSRDSIKSHENFKAKHGFPFELISDPDEQLCKLFDVIREKKNYGRVYMGVVRSTFIIDGDGVLREEFRNVRVKGHVEKVLEAVQSL